MIQLGSKIKTLREHKDLSQNQLAIRAGVDPSHISKLETGKTSGSVTTLQRIAAALDVPLSAILDEPAQASGE